MRIKIRQKYATTTEREFYQQKKIARVLRGMLAIAKIAMLDTYFATDRRVRAARRLLKEVT